VKTSLNLLTRDGAVYVSFATALTGDQYAELLEVVKRPSSDQEFRDALNKWAQFNGLAITFEEVTHGALR
jgi:predicted nucleotidyltransferase